MSRSKEVLLHLFKGRLRWWFFAVCLAGCTPHRSQQPHTPAPRGSAVGTRAPDIDGSRLPCLEPPYAPSDDESTIMVDEIAVAVRRMSERRWQVTLPLSAEASEHGEGGHVLRDRVVTHEGVGIVNYGLYCDDSSAICFIKELNLCEESIEEVVTRLTRAFRAETVAGEGLRIAIELVGATGPRCEEGDAECGPILYGSNPRAPGPPPASGTRQLGPLAHYSAGECSHDGECGVGGCGNHCTSWHYGAANEAATCEGYAMSEPIYCGCVEGLCGWFTME